MAGNGFSSMGGAVPTFRGVGTASARLNQNLSSGSNLGLSVMDFAGNVLKKYALGQMEKESKRIKSEQEIAGAAHGLAAAEGNVPLTLRDDPDSVGGAAFNSRASQAYLTSMALDIRDTASKHLNKFTADPAGFEEAFTQYEKGLLKQAPSALHADIKVELKSRKLESLRLIEGNYEKREKAGQKVSVLTGLDAFSRDYENAWRRGDQQSATEAANRFTMSLEAAVNNGLVDPTSAANMMSTLQSEGVKQTVLGQFDRVVEAGGIQDGESFIRDFKKSKSAIDPDLKDRIISSMTADVSGLKAEARVRDRELEQTTDNIISVIEKGYEPNGVEAIRDDIKGTKHEAKLDAALADRDYIKSFAKQAPEDQALVLEALAEKKHNKRSASLLERLEKTASNTRMALEKDPMGHALSVGIVDAPGVLDLAAAPQDLALAMRARARAALKIEETFNRPALPITAGEITQLEGMLETADAQRKTMILGGMTQGFGPKNMREIARKIAPKQQAFAMAAMLAPDDPATANQILIGEEVLAADPQLKPKRTDFLQSAEDYFEDALAHSPSDQTHAVEAALSIYAAEIQKEGKPTETFDPDRFTRALDRVTGGLVEWNDQKIFPPLRGMKQPDFEKFMDSLDEDDLTRFSVGGVAPTWRGGKKLEIDVLVDYGELTPIAPGQYRVTVQGRDIQGGGPNGIYVIEFDQPTVLARLGRVKPTEVARGR